MNQLIKILLPIVILLLPAMGSAQGMTALPGAKISVLENARLSVVSGNILLKASATEHASLNVQGNSSSVSISGTGAQTMAECYISQNSWHYVSSPLSSATADTYSYLWLLPFEEPANNWSNYILDPDAPLLPGSGYAAWSKSDVTGNTVVTYKTSASVSQTAFNQGDLPFNLTYSGVNKGFNLVGNPFPCAIDLDAAASWNRANVGNAVYFWDESIQNYRYYLSNPGYTGTSVNGGVRYVPAMQGFFVAASGSTPTMSIPNAARLHNTTAFYKSVQSEPATLRIKANANGVSDETVIRFTDEGTVSFDPEYDALKMKAEILQIYSSAVANSPEHYALNSLPDSDMNTSVPVFLEVPATVQITLQISGTEGFNAGLPLYLYDNKTGLSHNIRIENELILQATPGDPSPRFLLTTGTGLSIPENNNKMISAFISEGSLNIIGLPENQFPIGIKVYSVSGQLMKQFDIRQNSCLIDLPTGFYLINFTGRDFSETLKIFNSHSRL